MRLWHEALIPYLPRQQLLGQHRECCALRGLGWGKPHSTVNYVFSHPYGWLVAYHILVMAEMQRRDYTPDHRWFDAGYRGESCDGYTQGDYARAWADCLERYCMRFIGDKPFIYPEHNAAYLRECLDNLAGKGIHIDMGAQKRA